MEPVLNNIPEDILTRVPLFKPQWINIIKKMRGHPHAPEWNTVCGDRLVEEDLPFIKKFEELIFNSRKNMGAEPGDDIIKWIKSMGRRSIWFEESLKSINPGKNFTSIKFMERKDMQIRLELIVPVNESLDRLIVNPTSGTTGQPIPCPNHPKAVGCYDIMIKAAMLFNGIKLDIDYNHVAAIQLCAQKHTITYNTVHSNFEGAGFAKINITSNDWKNEESPGIYISDMEPVLFSGDPYAFIKAMEMSVNYKPAAILSTAITLDKKLRKDLEALYSCAVVDIYSLNETGPIAYSCPENPGTFHILPTDIFVETIDDDGNRTKESEPGEITVTGGRNPYLPLLRYKTGDYGTMDFSPCTCSDPMPKIKNMNTRKPVIFKSITGATVNPVDISRIVRHYPVAMHQFIQKKDLTCLLRLCVSSPMSLSTEKMLYSELRGLFGKGLDLKISKDLSIDEKKIIPFINKSDESI